MHLTHHWKMWDSPLYGPQGGKIQLGSLGYVHGPSCLPWWGESDSSAYGKEKPGGGGVLHLGTRVSSSGCVASSGSNAFGSLGAVIPTSGSALGISNSAVPSEVGATGSFSTTSNISRSSRSPLWITEVRHLWSSYTALQSTHRGIPEWTAHLWRAIANVTVSSAHTTW